MRPCKRQALGNGVAYIRRQIAFAHDAAPTDIAGISWRDVRQKLTAYCRKQPIGGNQQIARDARSIGKDRPDTVNILLDAFQRDPAAVA